MSVQQSPIAWISMDSSAMKVQIYTFRIGRLLQHLRLEGKLRHLVCKYSAM